VKALLDEMIPRAVAEQLRKRGRDVIAVTERPELRALADRDIWAAAQADERAIVTRDRADYLMLEREERAAGHGHAGLILVSSHYAPAAVGALVAALDVLLDGDAPYPGFVQWL
jgi:Domain of unknown function (DUF5615)